MIFFAKNELKQHDEMVHCHAKEINCLIFELNAPNTIFIETPNSYSNNLIENFDWFMMASFTFSIFFAEIADLARPDRLSSIDIYNVNIFLLSKCSTRKLMYYCVRNRQSSPYTIFIN